MRAARDNIALHMPNNTLDISPVFVDGVELDAIVLGTNETDETVDKAYESIAFFQRVLHTKEMPQWYEVMWVEEGEY